MAAGDWLSSAGLGDANIAVAARTIQVAIHSSVKNMEVLGHPVIRGIMAKDAALGALMGELGVSVSLAALGQGKLASTAEGTEATPTNFSTTNSATVTPGRRAYARDVGDFGRALGEPMLRGDVDSVSALIAYEGLRLWFNDWLDRIVALATSATYEIGTTATALTWEEINEGVVAFKNRGAARGSALGFLSAKGANDLNADSLALGGAFQFTPEAAASVMSMQSGAFLGNRNGVDWFLSSELDTNTGDDMGIVLTEDAVLSKHARVSLPAEADQVLDLGMFTVEARRPGGGLSRLETVSHNAVGILDAEAFAAVRYLT